MFSVILFCSRIHFNHFGAFDEIPHFDEVVDIFGKSLDSDQKKIIYDYLKKIALSDDDFDETEQKLLENLSNKWKLKIK